MAGRFHQRLLRQLIVDAGGSVDDIFVTQPGCRIVAVTSVVPAALELFAKRGIEGPDYQMLAEMGTRLTYMSFRKNSESDELLDRVARQMQHLSVFAGCHATFLIAGVSVETSMELVAHGEATVARLTSSKTKAMAKPLYRIQGSPEQQRQQRQEIVAMIESRGERRLPNELHNICNPGAKATALLYTMSLKDYHKLFIGRIPEGGNETEVREICTRMCAALRARYPLVIRAPEEYAQMNNGAKYDGS